jgi:hypothetical protein
MLNLKVQLVEGFDNSTGKFVDLEVYELELEHSLVSLSKWEEFFHKPFLSDEKKTPEETLYYIQCMVLDGEIPDEVWGKLTEAHMQQINDYINDPHTGTTFSGGNDKPSRERISSELIYYWMTALQIDWQAQYWHLNRLMTLIKVANLKNQPQKKMNQREAAQRFADLNRQRLAANGGQG